MLDIVFLKFQAPLMSFGDVAVDQHRPTAAFPTSSMLTGLIGNALGYDHADFQQLDDLQARIRFAARRDRAGQRLIDYQTVDLGQPFLVETGWTTDGVVEGRNGASSKLTHIRNREYFVDAEFIVALTLIEGTPDLDAVAAALERPERPLFIGRKCCIPASPILVGRTRAPSLYQAIRIHFGPEPYPEDPLRYACWPQDEGPQEASHLVEVFDRRDWRNQVHGGRRLQREGTIRLQGVNDAG